MLDGQKLVDRIFEQDNEAYGIFAKKYGPYIKAIAFQYSCGDQETSKDIIQEIMYRIFSAFIKERVILRRSLKSYVIRASINTALNYVNKEKRNKAIPFSSYGDDEKQSTDCYESEIFFNCYIHNPDLYLEKKITDNVSKNRLVKMIDSLPYLDKSIVVDRYNGYTNGQIADKYGISEDKVKNRIKSLKQQKDKFDKKFKED